MKRLLLALTVLFGLAPAAHAQVVSITGLKVEILFSEGPAVFTPDNTGWQLPINLSAGQDVVFTQNCGPATGFPAPTYCFDTSDAGCQYSQDITHCDTGWPLIRLTVNGLEHVFWDYNRVLTLKGHDPLDPANESQELTPIYQATDFDVYVGYWDNIHTDPCGSYPTSVGLFGAVNCLPAGVGPGISTYFQGIGVPLQAGLTQTQPNHCVFMNIFHPCIDAGMLRVVAHTNLVAPTPAPLQPGDVVTKPTHLPASQKP